MYGAFVRKSANQGWINNLTVGGYPELAQVTPEELVRVSIDALLNRPEEEFRRALGYVLRKNAELYKRLA